MRQSVHRPSSSRVTAAATLAIPMSIADRGLKRANAFPLLFDGAGMLIVALTGWGKENDRHKSAEAGFDSHLVKPVDHKVLARLLDAGGDNP